jgi:hypothetical protein
MTGKSRLPMAFMMQNEMKQGKLGKDKSFFQFSTAEGNVSGIRNRPMTGKINPRIADKNLAYPVGLSNSNTIYGS